MDYSYLGSGKVYLREVGAAAALLAIGNCSQLAFAIAEEVKELKDYTQPGGGTYNEVRRIQSVEATITMHDLSPENLARALYGTTTAVTATPVTQQLLGGAYAGGYMLFPSAPNTTPAPIARARNGRLATARANSAAVTLDQYLVPATPNDYYYKVTTAGTTGATIPTFPTTVGATVTDGTAELTCMGRIVLTANTDYELTAAGATLLTGGAFTAGEPIEADYTPLAADVVQALTTSGKEYELVFEGLNEARSGKPVTVQAYRVKIGAARNIGLLGDDYAALEVTGKLLKDTSKTGAGVSQYFKAAVVR